MKKSEPPAITSHVIKMYLNKQTQSKKRSNLSYLNFNPFLNLREGQKKTKKNKKKIKKKQKKNESKSKNKKWEMREEDKPEWKKASLRLFTSPVIKIYCTIKINNNTHKYFSLIYMSRYYILYTYTCSWR